MTEGTITIETAWKDKNAQPEEWLRDEASAERGEVKEHEATFDGIVQDDSRNHSHGNPEQRVAVFYSTRNGRRFDIAARLAPSDLQRGDIVRLTVLGCCSIVAIQRRK